MPAAPASPWATLLPAALVGTRRQPFVPLPGLTPALGSEADATEKQLLLTAANLALVQRAGQRLSGGAEALPPPPKVAAPRRPLSAMALALLRQALADSLDRYVSQDFLLSIYRAGYYVALADARLVLDALVAAGRPRLLFWYPALLGRRGPWLAAAHPHPAIRAEAPFMTTRWLTALPLERQWGTIRHWQQLGPAAGDSFEQLLPSLEHPASQLEQAALLYALASEHYQLPVSFQPVLEALATPEDDSSYEVRCNALRLLALLPGYDLAGRVWPHAAACLQLEAGPTGPRLRVHPPAAWQRAWEWAGLQRPAQYLDHPLHWLEMLLAVPDPGRWAAAWQVTPAEAVALATASEKSEVVLNGWFQATVRHGNVAFGRALLASLSYPLPSSTWWLPLAEVRALLPAPEQLSWLQAMVPHLPPTEEWATTPAGGFPPAVLLLGNVAGNSLESDRWLLAVLQAYATPPLTTRSANVTAVLEFLLPSLSRRVDPTLLPLVQAAAGCVAPSYAALFQQVATDLAFRREAMAALPELAAN